LCIAVIASSFGTPKNNQTIVAFVQTSGGVNVDPALVGTMHLIPQTWVNLSVVVNPNPNAFTKK